MLFMMNKNTLIAAVAVVALLGNQNGAHAATCGKMPEGVLPQDGEECKDVMTEGKSMIGCAGEQISGTTKTAASCECEPSVSTTWTCKTSESTIVQNPCPGEDDPKANGDSCAGLVSEPNAQQRCMWSQTTSMDAPVESYWCTCANTGDNANVWTCDGTGPDGGFPVSASTDSNVGTNMMDANTTQDIVTEQVDTPAGNGTGTMSVCPDEVVTDGSSCDGFLQGTLPEAACTFYQTTQANNDAPITTNATCTCAAADPSWRCDGSLVSVSKANDDSDIADVDVAEKTDEATADVAEKTDEATADVAEKTDEATTDVAEKTDEATADVTAAGASMGTDVAAATDESVSGATAASMNFATLAFFVVAVLATTTTIL